MGFLGRDSGIMQLPGMTGTVMLLANVFPGAASARGPGDEDPPPATIGSFRPFGSIGSGRPFGSIGSGRPFGSTGSMRPFGSIGTTVADRSAGIRPFGPIGSYQPGLSLGREDAAEMEDLDDPFAPPDDTIPYRLWTDDPSRRRWRRDLEWLRRDSRSPLPYLYPEELRRVAPVVSEEPPLPPSSAGWLDPLLEAEALSALRGGSFSWAALLLEPVCERDGVVAARLFLVLARLGQGERHRGAEAMRRLLAAPAEHLELLPRPAHCVASVDTFRGLLFSLEESAGVGERDSWYLRAALELLEREASAVQKIQVLQVAHPGEPGLRRLEELVAADFLEAPAGKPPPWW